MPSLGFSRKVIDWHKSYLFSRKLYVNVHDKFSTSAYLRWGVKQGSILGPFLFLLYINDMPQAVDCDLFLYADDTCLLFQHKDLERIKEELTKNFSNICDWFVDNKLSIHFGEDKTKSILFSTKNRKRKIGTLDNIWTLDSGHQNQAILKSNIFRLWVRRELVGRGQGFESYKQD